MWSWWRHQMETLSALLAICAGNSPVSGEFPAQWPVTRSFDVFFDLCLNKWWSKQSRGWWFKTSSRPLWRHCNVADWLKSINMSLNIENIFLKQKTNVARKDAVITDWLSTNKIPLDIENIFLEYKTNIQGQRINRLVQCQQDVTNYWELRPETGVTGV